MNEPGMNYTAIMACLVHPPQQKATQTRNQIEDITKEINSKDQKVFTELRPANNSGKPTSFQGDPLKVCAGNFTKDNMDNSDGGLAMMKATSINWVRSSSSIDSFPAVKNSVKVENDIDCVEEMVQQQIMTWNPNNLAEMGDIMLYDLGNAVEDVIEFDSKNLLNHVISGNNNIKNENADFMIPEAVALTEEEFKFPACVEEQYRHMMGLLTSKEDNNLPSIETIFSRPISLSQCKTTLENERMITKNFDEKSLVHKHISQITNEAVNEGKNDPHMYEAREVEADIDDVRTSISATANAENNNEDVEKVLNLINPDADIMGKTFHKIPSTQPIYNDSESRQSEIEDENRIRRPMNAFMLWARKYRSLVAKEFSDASNSEISVKLGEIWNELSSELQKPYFRKAESLKAEHKLNHPNYVYQPRQAKAKQSRRNKELKDTWLTINGEKSTTAVKSMISDFTGPINVCTKSSMPGVYDVGHVASTVVLSQNGTEVDLINHVRNQPQIMTPKPVYPMTMRKRKEKQVNAGTEECDEIKELVTKGSVIKDLLENDELKRENQTRMTEQVFCRHNELGLLKDAMLPSIDRNGDECDMVSSMYSGLDVADLDAYLAGVNSEFGEYLETHCLSDDYNNSSTAVLHRTKTGKRKQETKKSHSKFKKKQRT